MLILSRYRNEEIVINDVIIVKFLGMNKYAARIGIEAPLDVKVWRREFYEKMQTQKRYEEQYPDAQFSSE